MTQTNPAVHPEHERLMRLATGLSLCVAAGLVIVKTIAWSMSDSLSLMASMFDSFFDVLASLINYMAIRYALTPPDDEHRFGHGKAEDIAALAQATFIAGSGMFILVEGVKRLFSPEPVEHGGIGLMVMVLSIVLTFALVLFQRHVVRKTGSIAVQSDSLHYLSDILSNAGVIAGLALTYYMEIPIADPLFALLVAGYIFYGAWRIGYAAFHNLMDREFDEEERKKIIDISSQQKLVLDVHELKTRKSGIYHFIQLHLVFDEHISLKESHRVADEVEAQLKAIYPNAEVLIHQDPYGAA